MRVLVACECSGLVRDAFIALGHDAWSCDLKPSETPGPHYQCSIWDVIDLGWDLLIAHPPCTYLSLSGARWLTDHWVKNLKGDYWHDGAERREKHKEALEFFSKLLHYKDIPRRCLENPMSMASTHWPKDQVIHPWQYGHGEVKETWLWLKNLPPLVPTNIVAGRRNIVHSMAPGPNRSTDRSRTYTGIATAMAEQWGSLPPYVEPKAGVQLSPYLAARLRK